MNIVLEKISEEILVLEEIKNSMSLKRIEKDEELNKLQLQMREVQQEITNLIFENTKEFIELEHLHIIKEYLSK